MDNMPVNGVYKTRPNWYKQTGWPVNRHVFIQGDSVCLVSYIAYGETEYRREIYSYRSFFEANELGERVGPLPEGDFSVWTYQGPPKEEECLTH